MKFFCRMLSAALLLRVTTSAHACTVCGSANGKALRAGLFDGHFLHTSMLVLAPVPALFAAVVALYFTLPDLQTEPESDTLAVLDCEAAA